VPTSGGSCHVNAFKCNTFYVVHKSSQRSCVTNMIKAPWMFKLFSTSTSQLATLLRFNCKTFALNGLRKYQDQSDTHYKNTTCRTKRASKANSCKRGWSGIWEITYLCIKCVICCSILTWSDCWIPNARSRLLDYLRLDYDKVQEHMNKKSQVHWWTCLNENLYTFLFDFTPRGKEEVKLNSAQGINRSRIRK